MKIISKFHDYYDSGMGYGHDDTLIYKRTPLEVVELRRPEPYKYGYYHELNNYVGRVHSTFLDATFFVVGFCGKLYLGIEISYTPNTREILGKVRKCFYNVEDVSGFVALIDNKDLSARFNQSEPEFYWHTENFCYEVIKRRFESFKKLSTKYENRFRDNHSPLFTVTCTPSPKNELLFTYNANLGEHYFYKVFACTQAFQEIEMYLGGVLGRGEKETLGRKDFPDEPLIRDSKGFDKWSFKKRKQP